MLRKSQAMSLLKSSKGGADEVSRAELLTEIEALRQASRRHRPDSAINPFPRARPAQLSHNVNFMLSQLSSYRGPDIASLRRGASRRARILAAIEGFVFVLGLVVGALVYFSAFCNGAEPLRATIGLMLSLSCGALVPRLHRKLQEAIEVRRQLGDWSVALYADRARATRETRGDGWIGGDAIAA